MTCIATCYSHFGALRFEHLCQSRSWPARLMPVPRDLSSSCGTCVRYEADTVPASKDIPGEVEQIVAVEQDCYRTLYRAGNRKEEQDGWI